jgi:hypothetical protein
VCVKERERESERKSAREKKRERASVRESDVPVCVKERESAREREPDRTRTQSVRHSTLCCVCATVCELTHTCVLLVLAVDLRVCS